MHGQHCDRCGRVLTLADVDGPLLMYPPYRFLCNACRLAHDANRAERGRDWPPARGLNGDPVDLVAP